MKPKLKVTFTEPAHGYWDGGAKSGGEFTPDCTDHPGAGHNIKWGCWELNFWFVVGSGISWKAAARIAQRFLARRCRWSGTTIEVCWEKV